jgi:hypothetical protein
MVEPIGLTGTLIGILQVTCKIVMSCYEYHKTVKDAPIEISRILDELKSVRNVAERLESMTRGDNGNVLLSVRAMNDPGGPLQTCLQELSDLDSLLQPGKRTGRAFILRWPLTKTQVERSLAAIGRIKDTLQLTLMTDTT